MSAAKFKPFKSVGDFKSKSEFFKKGSILPSRILKCSKARASHACKAGSNQYAIPTPSGYFVFVESKDGDFDCALRFTSIKNARFKGSPYQTNGDSLWGGNCGHKDENETILMINKKLSEMWGIK